MHAVKHLIFALLWQQFELYIQTHCTLSLSMNVTAHRLVWVSCAVTVDVLFT